MSEDRCERECWVFGAVRCRADPRLLWHLTSGICRLIPARPGGDRLSRALRRSTIGAEGFHGRVRDGIGCWPLAIATRPCGDQRTDDRGRKETGVCHRAFSSSVFTRRRACRCKRSGSPFCLLRSVIRHLGYDQAFDRAISTGQRGDCSLCTSGLSTWWSTTALGETWF